MRMLSLLIVAALTVTQTAAAGVVYQQVNGDFGRGPAFFFWNPNDIGWYWTPETDLMLEGIQTQLATANNINNNVTFTTTLYSDRPAAGGTALGSFTWNGTAFVDGPWLGGSFASAISLLGGTQYFVGMTGWEAPGNQGVNWTDAVTAQNLGGGSSYFSVGGNPPGTFETRISVDGSVIVTDQPILRFIAADVVTPTPVPEPSSLAILSLGCLLAGCFSRRNRR